MIITPESWDQAHAELAQLFDATPPYPGYKPEVKEAPNGDGRVDAGKRYLHVAKKYGLPSEDAAAILACAHWEACRVAEEIGVPAEFYPRVENSTLRVLEYPSAACVRRAGGDTCMFCDALTHDSDTYICPVRGAGNGSAEHTDFDLFTLNLWRSTDDHQHWDPWLLFGEGGWAQGAAPYHRGELGELIGLGPAVKHRVPARPYPQRAIVYFAMPAGAARLPCSTCSPGDKCVGFGLTVNEWLADRYARSRVYK